VSRDRWKNGAEEVNSPNKVPERLGAGRDLRLKAGKAKETAGDSSLPPTGWFWAKSAEAVEKKRVEFFVSAKKCKRVRKNLKRKGID
jgi:hypothetical protein